MKERQGEKANVDSREYRFIYRLRNCDDIPADFPSVIRHCDFDSGIFVPQGDSNWFQQRSSSPARLLLLKGRSLQVVSHPTSQERSLEIDLSDLLQLETGTVLLVGWLKWTTPSGTQELRYNTRASDPMDQFLRTLRRRWLRGEPKLADRAFPTRYGDELDIQFKNLLQNEIDPGEAPILLYFQAPAKFKEGNLLRRRVEWKPGTLLSLTTDRLLWITDQDKRYRDPYLSVNRSAPAALLRGCEYAQADGKSYLTVSFDSGMSWSIAVDGATSDLGSFIETFHEATCSKSLPDENK